MEGEAVKAVSDRIKAALATEVTMGGGNYFKVPPNTTKTVRVLPEKEEGGSFFLERVQHHGFTVDGGNRAIPCQRIHRDGALCLPCILYEWLNGQSDPRFKSLASQIRPKKQWIVQVVARDENNSIQFWGVGPMIWGQIKTILGNPKFGDVVDPENGMDLMITRTGSTREDTEYQVLPDPERKPVGVANWQDKLLDLNATVMEWDVEEIKRVVFDNYAGKVRDLAKILEVEA